MTKTKRKVERTLNIVRYNSKELLEFLTDKFYEHVATETNMYFMDKVAPQGKLRPRTRYEQRQKRIEDIKFRIKDYEKRRELEQRQEDKDVYTEGIQILADKLYLEENFDIEHQKIEYAKTGDVFSSRTFTEFPLNKMINGLYDDFNAVVLHYDNLTNDEIITKLENAETLEEKKQIVKDNMEITHFLLTHGTGSRVSIALTGKLDPVYSDPNNDNATSLPPKFMDLDTLTLQDVEMIKNNDLAQLLQELIDMDKEGLVPIAEMTIKGEDYSIVKSPYTDKEYIRYVCPSTQRVYHNVLVHEYLQQSPYFKEGNAESYIKAWYSIANLFIELTDEEIAKPSISC